MNEPSASAFFIKTTSFFIKKNLTDCKSKKNIIFHCALKNNMYLCSVKIRECITNKIQTK